MKIYSYLLILIIISIFYSCDNSDPGKIPVLSIDESSFEEEDVDVDHTINIRLSEATDKKVTVVVKTANGLARHTEDYSQIDRLVIFEPGQIQTDLTITIIGDQVNENDETFTIAMSEPINARIEQEQITITIIDDDDDRPFGLDIPTEGYESPLSYDNMDLVWQDEFESETLNMEDWTFETGTGTNGWGNFELQYYRQDNTSLIEGNLIIAGRQESYSGSQYTSSRIITMDKQSFQYGRIDIRAALPEGQGMWPALWMLGANYSTVGWPACGEIDIMEMVGGGGRENTVLGTVHWLDNGNASYGGEFSLQEGTFHDNFHVFSIVWDSSTIRWFVDNQQYHVIDITPEGLSEFHQEFFLIMNLAIGGTLPGNPDNQTMFPQFLIVDYVRVFQEN